jgi:hypothetical protein
MFYIKFFLFSKSNNTGIKHGSRFYKLFFIINFFFILFKFIFNILINVYYRFYLKIICKKIGTEDEHFT